MNQRRRQPRVKTMEKEEALDTVEEVFETTEETAPETPEIIKKHTNPEPVKPSANLQRKQRNVPRFSPVTK